MGFFNFFHKIIHGTFKGLWKSLLKRWKTLFKTLKPLILQGFLLWIDSENRSFRASFPQAYQKSICAAARRRTGDKHEII